MICDFFDKMSEPVPDRPTSKKSKIDSPGTLSRKERKEIEKQEKEKAKGDKEREKQKKKEEKEKAKADAKAEKEREKEAKHLEKEMKHEAKQEPEPNQLKRSSSRRLRCSSVSLPVIEKPNLLIL